jgi:hypothetical protein
MGIATRQAPAHQRKKTIRPQSRGAAGSCAAGSPIVIGPYGVVVPIVDGPIDASDTFETGTGAGSVAAGSSAAAISA